MMDAPAAKPRFLLPPYAWAAIAAVLCVSLILLQLGRAPNSEKRIAALEQSVAAMARESAAKGNAGAFPDHAVCAHSLYPGFRDQLDRSLATSGIQVVALDIGGASRANAETRENAPLDAYPVHLVAKGSYESAVSALSILGHAHPAILVDHFALRNQTSSVSLTLEGRVFCRSRTSN
jgi:hypothetical protein